MSLSLNPDMLAAAYEFLRASPPFRGWRPALPDAETVEFHITRSQALRGRWCVADSGAHRIEISCSTVGHSETLIRTVAHEMIHLYQREAGTETPNAMHNAEFHRLKRLVCLGHGWDPRSF